MSRSSYRTLVDLGRKAGLRTSELYSVLATRPPEAHDPGQGQADSNGYVSGRSQTGRPIYHPREDHR
jgi:hypothetical protein